MATQVQAFPTEEPALNTPDEQAISDQSTPLPPTMLAPAVIESQHTAVNESTPAAAAAAAAAAEVHDINEDNAVNAQHDAEELAKAHVLEQQAAAAVTEDAAIVPMNNHDATTPIAQEAEAPLQNGEAAAPPAEAEQPAEEEAAAAAVAAEEHEAEAAPAEAEEQQQAAEEQQQEEEAVAQPTALELASHRSPAEAEALAAAEERARQAAQLEADAAAKKEAEAAKAKAEAEAEHEADLEERRQLCSEIVALRKELAIVKEDEENLRKQLTTTACIIAEHSPSSEADLAALEAEAQQSQLHQLWEEECQRHNPDKMDWATIDIQGIAARVAAAKEDFHASQERVTAMFANLEKEINAHTDYRDETKNKMKLAFEEEMAATSEARARLRQVDEEQKFHHRRGTTRRGAANVVPEEKTTLSRQRRIARAEAITTEKLDKLTSELSDLMSDCKMLKQRLDNTRSLQSKKEDEMKATMTAIHDSGDATRQIKEKLLKEQEELNALKADLQSVLHYVRAKQREEEEIL